ncbi:23S rRNA pseudouridine2605 synthase [Deinobacterium chartae]|uniref:Pseudouridine synthase n=1 Tax=Deinobacterium chartae TaxID=521158 RepID=A0A841I170_9DEIO|nr:pseudouridine synthase [Deinobacterium chartae]MBB6098018.1 23S rRNA pseudouridine2605 synthase [Deinobacterium chartae]
MERLQKLLARGGVASRRAAEDLIRRGRVTVNGKVASIGDSAEPSDDIRVDGKPLQLSEEKLTFMLYKPRGVVTTAHDELGRANVLERMPRVRGLHSVGRLDRNSEGLLLLTTDGDLTLRMTHPRFEHEKEYRVWTREPLSDADLQALASGIELEDGMTQPAQVERAEGGLFITLREGRNRQVRRMLEAVGCPVMRLVRVRMGGLFLGDLRPGEYRTLSDDDLAYLTGEKTMSPGQLRRERELMYQRWD